jgi:cellulose synthase operon protein C
MPNTLTFTRSHLLLLAIAVTLTACAGKEGRIESGLTKGAEFVRQSDWDKAGVEVRNVLQIDPKNARAYLIAAQVSEGQREPKRAYGQYQKALELKPDLLQAKTGLARLYLFVGDLVRAQASVREVLAAEPANVVARTLQAAILAREGKTTEALAQAKQVMAEGKTTADTSLLVAGLHANQHEWPQALAVVEAALKSEPRHLGLLQAAMELAAANPRDDALADKAVGFFRRATAEAPKSHELWLAWARYHLGRQEVDKAEAVLRTAIKAQPEDGKRTLALVEFLQTARGVDAAEKQYLQSITDKPRDMALRFGLVNLYRGTSRPAQAQKLLQEIIDTSDDVPNVVAARTQLAAYRLAAGKRDEASALLVQVLKANPRDSAALVLRARLQMQAGNPRDAVADLRAALRDQTGASEIVQLLAQAHRSAGEPQLARDALDEAVKARPEDPTLRALLAADMADAKDFKSALNEVDAGLKAAPQATPLYDLKVQLALAQNDPALALKTLEQLKAQRPGDAIGPLRMGQFLASQKRYDAALKAYDDAAS